VERTWSTELSSRVGDRVRLAGWLHRLRRLGGVNFAILRDGRGLAQVVVPPGAVVETLAALQPESVLEVEGTVVANEQAPGGVEVAEPSIRVIAVAEAPPPFELFRPTIPAGLAAVLDHAPIALRHPRHRALFRLAAASVAGFRGALDGLGFVEIHTPKIVGSATESGADVFAVDYFGRRAYLAQSPQFYKQVMVAVFERVYEVAPAFRAEPHDTGRHLNEYVSLDAELGFIEDHHTVMATLALVVEAMLDSAAERAGSALELLEVRPPKVPGEIPIVHFSEAQAMIAEATGASLEGELDLSPEHERWLGEWALREHASDFVFVEGYPMGKRPFYTHPDPSRPAFSNSFDLLFRGMEVVTGGQRLHRHADYRAALRSRGEDPAAYDWYLEAFRHGMPPHGGFAMGLERWVARLTRESNVRTTALFPRDRHRVSP
jgi:nondiscriminating aspartyl-tRNA synthetase